MTPLPAMLGGTELVTWRLDAAAHASTWFSGEGAFLHGGRWNTKGVRAVYSSLDPATTILEVAVHKGFRTLDTVAHVLTAVNILDTAAIHIVDPVSLPNPNWLRPGIPSFGQQSYGNQLLSQHKFVAIPSAVSNYSWNLIFVATNAAGSYDVRLQEPFALDTRLHPPVP
jgi:RES domain-containing protein